MAADLLELYDEAEEAGIDVAWFPLCEDRSMALQLNDASCAIAIDPWKMYTLADDDIRKKHENRADKWAIQRLIPLSELDAARADGHTELWDLAEYFGVTEDMMRKALCWYAHGNLAAEQYF